MKFLKHTVSLLCALALLLSLAPCAFAEVTDPVGEKTEISDGQCNISGNITVTSNGTLEVSNASGYSAVVVNGDLTNEGTVTSTGTSFAEVKTQYGSLINENTITVTSSGSYANVDTFEGDLSNSGTITVTGNDHSFVKSTYGDLINEGTVTATGYGGTSDVYTVYGDLINSGTITALGKTGSDIMANYSDLINEGVITSISSDGLSRVCTSGNELINSGSIACKGKTDADVASYFGNLTNNAEGVITLESSAENAGVTANGELTNMGSISVTAENGCAHLDSDVIENIGTITLNGSTVYIGTSDENFHNFGTVVITGDASLAGTYYGVYFEEDGVMKSALLNWKNGKAGEAAALDAGTKDGHRFMGWELNGQKLEGNTMQIGSGPISLKALWEKIINKIPIPSGDSGCTEKNVEKIVKHIDAKVLDADHREMEIETEYLAVAKTSFGRLIVLFSWEQMTQMEPGEHLFYIVTPDGAETEYVLTTW